MLQRLATYAKYGLAFTLLAFIAGAVTFKIWFPKIWRPLLVVQTQQTPVEPVDAIILLGGESQARPLEAARLYREGVAPKVFVIGTGDTAANRRLLMANGVPEDAIAMEPHSSSTWENARFARPLLESTGIRRAVLVTSSFHARRSLATFQQSIPGIDFRVVTSRIGWWDTVDGRPQEDSWAAKEMLKIPGYWIFHGIAPWVTNHSSTKASSATEGI